MKKAQDSVSQFKRHLDGVLGNMKGQMAAALAGVGAGFAIHQGTQDAIKYEALMGTLNESMGNSITTFEKWQDETGSAMGFSKLAGAELANTLSLNFKKISTSTEDLVAKTTKMMETAAIISNKRGMLMSEVSDRIRSAMNQEADGADELGVNVRVAAIEASNAYKMMGASGPWDKLSENMRKTILYHHILEQVTGNLGNTLQDNVRLRLSAFQASLGDVRLALGQAFLPILYTVLPLLTSFMRGLERTFQYISAFVRAMFGYKVGTKEAIKNTNATLAQTGAMQGLGKAAEETGKKASKAAKEIKRGVAGFDEVNLLNETGGAGSGAGEGADVGVGEGGGMPPDMGLPQEPPDTGWMDSVSDQVDRMTEKFRKFFDTSKGFKDLREGFKMFGDSVNDFYHSPALEGFMNAFKEDLPQFFDDLMGIGGGFFKFLSGRLDKFSPDWKKQWEGMGKQTIGIMDGMAGFVGLIFPDLGEKMQSFNDKAEKGFKNFTKEFVKDSSGIKETWKNATNEMKAQLGTKLGEMVLVGTGKYKELKESMIKNIIEGTKENKKSFDEFKTSASNSLSVLRDNSSWIFGVVKQTIKDRMKEAGIEFKNPFTPIPKWFDDNVVKPINKYLRGLDSTFDGSFGSALRVVANEIFKKFNGFLGKIAGFGVAGKYPFSGITRFAIPPLAKGGITSGAMLAMIGDNPSGHEVVAPLEKLQPMLVQAVTTALAFNNGNRNNTGGDIVLNIDGRQFARIVKPHLEKEAQRVGANVRLNPI